MGVGFYKFTTKCLTFLFFCGIIYVSCERGSVPSRLESVPVDLLRVRDFVSETKKGLQVRPTQRVREVYVPQEGSITVEPLDKTKKLEEVVVVTIKDRGLTFRPGVFYGYPHTFGVDCKLAFYRRFGLGVGLGYGGGSGSIILHGSYRLDRIRFIRNTEVMLGLDQKKQVILGLRINL